MPIVRDRLYQDQHICSGIRTARSIMGNGQSAQNVEDMPCGYRVLGVQPNSPASKVGLVSFFDFIVASRGELRGLSRRLANCMPRDASPAPEVDSASRRRLQVSGQRASLDCKPQLIGQMITARSPDSFPLMTSTLALAAMGPLLFHSTSPSRLQFAGHRRRAATRVVSTIFTPADAKTAAINHGCTLRSIETYARQYHELSRVFQSTRTSVVAPPCLEPVSLRPR